MSINPGEKMKNLVLIRHGQSVWNKENKFTGWVNVDLSENGVAEAKKAAERLKSNGFDQFQKVFTSRVRRANGYRTRSGS